MEKEGNMLTGKENLLQSLIEAFLLEKGTMELYSEAYEKASSKDVKRAFSELSDWEAKHMDYIQFLYQSIQGDKEIKSFEDFKNRTEATDSESGIPVEILEEQLKRHPITGEMDALTLAMEIEGKAYNLYNRLSKNAEDPNARIVFSVMKDQEIKHINYLKKLRVKLADPYN